MWGSNPDPRRPPEMRSVAAAFGWEFRQRHRWPLIAFATFVVAVTAYGSLLVEDGATLQMDPPEGLAGFLIAPLSIAFFYILAVFSFGLSGDLAARQSIYPARMFALPVTTAALAGWPMLYGAAAMTVLWLTAWAFAQLWNVDLPLVWPGLLAVTFMAWTQVFTWKTYAFRGLRVIVTVIWLISLDIIVILAVEMKASRDVLSAFLAPQLPLAYAAACFFLARARRGDVPDWRSTAWATPIAGEAARPKAWFRSAARAQAWFEWRLHGRTLPALVALVVPFELSLLFVPGNDVPSIVFTTLIVALLTPSFLAGFVAAAVNKANPFVRDSYGLAPFVAVRPMSSAGLVAAKLEMTLWSTLFAWALMLLIVPLALIWSGAISTVIERAGRLTAAIGTARAIVISLLVLAGLFASTWKHLVQNLCIGLTGRDWLIKGSVFASLVLIVLVFPAWHWVRYSGRVFWTMWDNVALILAVMVAFKMTAAAWVAIRLGTSGLLRDRVLIGGAVSWSVAVFALYGVFAWFVDTLLIPHYLLLLLAILQVPLTRTSAAPLALAWNRHR